MVSEIAAVGLVLRGQCKKDYVGRRPDNSTAEYASSRARQIFTASLILGTRKYDLIADPNNVHIETDINANPARHSAEMTR